MRLDKIIARSRIIDLRSLTLEAALEELLDVCIAKFPDLKRESILKGLLARETTMTTYLGLGVALPHVRVRTSRRYILAIGRSRAGMRHHGAMSGERVHLIIMLIAGESARDTLQVLASIGRARTRASVMAVAVIGRRRNSREPARMQRTIMAGSAISEYTIAFVEPPAQICSISWKVYSGSLSRSMITTSKRCLSICATASISGG